MNSFEPRVRILAPMVGRGLQRDAEVLLRVLSPRMEVTVCDVETGSYDPPGHLDIHLEKRWHPDRDAPLSALIPNPEWTQLCDLDVDVIWTKSPEDLLRYTIPARKVEYIGFSSENLFRSGYRRTRRFLHLAGGSPAKNTLWLIDAWVHLGITDTLWVIDPPGKIRDYAPAVRSPNVVLLRRQSREHIVELLNSSWFHLYPSAYEGWGQAVGEVLSTGGIPMVAFRSPFTSYLNSSVAFFLEGQEDRHRVQERQYRFLPSLVDFEDKLTLMRTLTDPELQGFSARVRQHYNRIEQEFAQRVHEAVARILSV